MNLVNPVTGREIRTDEASVGFWKSVGYRDLPKPKPVKKAAVKPSKK